MTGSFLDSTIVVEIADKGGRKPAADAYIAAHQPSATPYYALRELLAGHIQNICDTHNVLIAAESAPEAMLALLRRSPLEGRKKEAKIQILAAALSKAFVANPNGDRSHTKREVTEWLALRVAGLWRRARKINNVSLVQNLSCFNGGQITLGPSGELRGPRDSFTCLKTERCAAAAYLFDAKSNITKMVDALHPAKVDPSIAGKNETTKRRDALRELILKGPKEFSKTKCRALGGCK